MKSKFTLIVAITLVLLTYQHAYGQSLPPTTDESRTWIVVGNTAYEFSNGRAWKSLDEQSRRTYLLGIDEGLKLLFLQTSDRDRASLNSLNISGFRFSDLAQQVNVFYEDSANLRIPVIDAYKYTLAKLRGASATELETLVSGLRRKYNQ